MKNYTQIQRFDDLGRRWAVVWLRKSGRLSVAFGCLPIRAPLTMYVRGTGGEEGYRHGDREWTPHEAATLHNVMQEAIGEGLQEFYEPEKEVLHQMLVLLIQINRRQSQ